MNVVSIAVDAQGAEVARPWHEAAQAEFVTLVDQRNELGERYNLKAIPYGIMIDEFGRLVKGPFSINVADEDTIALLEKWLSEPSYNEVLIREASVKMPRSLKPMRVSNSVSYCWKPAKKRRRWQNGEQHRL